METSILSCPLCKEILSPNQSTYSCTNNHNYDVSKSGYLNLLLAHHKNSLHPGDSKEMVRSRLAFLQKGYYQGIAKEVSSYINNKPNVKGNIADIGCGVGYYLAYIKNSSTHKDTHYLGLDISKEAIQLASKTYNGLQWIVCGAKRLPLCDASINIALSIFSPVEFQELSRILANDGLLMMVTPGERHLYELRAMLFDEVHPINTDKVLNKASDYFTLSEQIPIRHSLHLSSQEDIQNLLKMTPYGWKSYPKKQEALLKLNSLEVGIDVNLWVFKRNDG
jgi:23S rRNA (guanine745-N1)-methyltransferase